MKFLIFFLIVSACGPKGNNAESKPLYSTWHNYGPKWNVDLSVQGQATWTYWSGGTCVTQVEIDPLLNQNYGVFKSAAAQSVKTYAGEPDCSMFNGTWTYYTDDKNLYLCLDGDIHNCLEFE